MAKFNFTKRSIEALKCPGKRVVYSDTKVKELKLRHEPSDEKLFYFKKKDRMHGNVDFKIGSYPQTTIEQARLKASESSNQLANGIDPRVEKQDRYTTSDLWNDYLEQHLKIHATPKSIADASGYFNLHIKPKFGNKDIKLITSVNTRKFFSSLFKEKGYAPHNKVLNVFKAMMNKAVEWKLIKESPITTKKVTETKRERFLLPEEMPAFFKALAEEPREWFKDYVYLSLLTGARQRNVLSMKWKDISFDMANWHIPMTKNGESLNVPLVPEAMELLKNKKREGEYVFQSTTSKYGYYIGVDRPWKELLGRAGLSDLKLHDLRRSLGSWQANLGTSLNIIGKSLGHKNVSTTAIYARLQTDPVRQSIEKATSAMLEAGEQKVKGKVVNIKN